MLPTIHMFWHGAPLSRIEKLCLTSFVTNGHRLELHVYQEPEGVPAGVTLKDAAQILAQEYVFRHRRTGSLALFADWFRYKLLLEQGGIWVDTDVVCLQPLRYEHPVVFGWQDDRYVNNAVLGLPPGHALAEWMLKICEDPNRALPYDGIRLRLRKWKRRLLYPGQRGRVRWGESGPKGLTHAASHLGCLDRAVPIDHFYPVAFDRWQSLFVAGPGAMRPGDSRAVHLWNNQMKEAPGFDKNGRFPADSVFEQLCARYL